MRARIYAHACLNNLRARSSNLALRGQALFPDLRDTPRGEKGLVSEMSRGVSLSWAWVLRCGHMTDYIAVDSLR